VTAKTAEREPIDLRHLGDATVAASAQALPPAQSFLGLRRHLEPV
jgi:hypothetical protein